MLSVLEQQIRNVRMDLPNIQEAAAGAARSPAICTTARAMSVAHLPQFRRCAAGPTNCTQITLKAA